MKRGSMPWDKRIRATEIVIPYDTLSLKAQEIIGDPKINSYSSLKKHADERERGGLKRYTDSINEERIFRKGYDLLFLGSLAASAAATHSLRNPEKLAGQFIGGTLSTASAGARTLLAHAVQKRHDDLISAMQKYGIVQTRFEENFPQEWINPTSVKKTHPIFYVDFKGNLHFLKESRIEYARHAFQKTWMGKIGWNPWNWRTYLRPPEVPESAVKWGKRKAMQWAQALTPKPAFAMRSAKGANHREIPPPTKPKRFFAK